MNIDWASLGLVAMTTVVAAIAIVGIFSLGVLALTSGAGTESGGAAVPNRPAAREAGRVRLRRGCPGCWFCTGCT